MYNSKKALELAILEYEKDLEYEETNQWVENVLKGLKEVKQDLEKLEKENQELRKSIKSWNENAGNQLREILKLKNVIDILVDELDIKLVTSIFADELGDYYLEFKIDTNKRILRKITKEKYELLKEVLNNE